MKDASANNPVMLYDGVCGFCNKSVQLILDHDKRGEMRFAALQSDYGQAVKARYPFLEHIDSVVLLEHPPDEKEERVFVRSSAALRLASYLGGAWKLFLVFYILPAPLRDFFYDLFAKHRYKFFGKYDACMLPDAKARSRFLDV
jgi:predicted DCC family thiol-disulfide oxidoreductase YuxK